MILFLKYLFREKNPLDCFNPRYQRGDKPIDTLSDCEKEVIFCQFEVVGTHRYGRVQIGKKQEMERNSRRISLHLNIEIQFLFFVDFIKILLNACVRTTFSTVWGTGIL